MSTADASTQPRPPTITETTLPSSFPSLVPALTFDFKIGVPLLVGSLSRGQPLTVVPIVSGRVVSEPSFGVALDARVRSIGHGSNSGGVDFVRNDPDGKRMRLDCGVVVEDVDNNLLHIHYTGVVDITPELSAILGGSPGMKSTEFGKSFIHVTFESGSEVYKELETSIYVGAGRFIVDERGLSVEYKVSRVSGGQGSRTGGDSRNVAEQNPPS